MSRGMRKGFTLIELIIVVIVIGILATVAVPQYLKATERAKGGKARNALGIVAGGMKLYRADNATNPDSYLGATLVLINNGYVELGDFADGSDGDWNYTLGGLSTTAFTVTATRAAGSNATETIIINQDGVFTGTFVP